MELNALVTNAGFYYTAEKIFSFLDKKSLNQCRLVSKSWCLLIESQKPLWTSHLIQDYNKVLNDTFSVVIDRQRVRFNSILDQAFPNHHAAFDYLHKNANPMEVRQFMAFFANYAQDLKNKMKT